VFLAFRPHSNAVIDMCFSRDDSLFATASGDQTARVVDMTTQRTISILAQHSASLKQVKFQPGAANNSVIATSSRDGSVQIWDLRCKGTKGPVQDIHIPMGPTSVTMAHSGVRKMSYGCIVNSIHDAHRPGHCGRLSQSTIARDGGERPGRLGDVSVTAIAFLPEGQEHMLLTASEANASVKLWDVRCLHHTRRKTALPLSRTALPESHNQWRHFGINSLNLNGNGSRLYALCRDNTVYAYSTAHLILGQAPELSDGTSRRRQQEVDVREGLGPMYGFRHRQLHATSFYVKAAIRPERAGKAETLAVGSCDGCTILFPTDEKYIEKCQKSPELEPASYCVRQTSKSTATYSRSKESIPISENGTPLIRGHDREVGSLTWTSEGELITVGDDYLVRCWREGHKARRLRTGGEEGGQRWRCGWADVPVSYDNDDEDDCS
jgi:WD40 repeat protein